MEFRIIIVLALLLMSEPVDGSNGWPVMREFELSIGVNFDSKRAEIDVPLYDKNDEVRYRLICRGGDDEFRGALKNGLGGVYLPPLTCILNPGDQEGSVSLLGEDQVNAYQTRGHVGGQELIGDCGDYPEYGRVRHFRLRGFELRIEFADVITRFPNDKPDSESVSPVEYAVMIVALRRDTTAQTAKAAQTGYLRPTTPGGGCDLVRKGNEPLMCRDRETFSWRECPAGWEYEPYPWEKSSQQE